VDWEKFLRKPWNRKLFHLSENEMGEWISQSWWQEFSLKRTLVIRYSPRAINPCNHNYPGMGRGLARSLFILVQESHNYIRVCGTSEYGLLRLGNNESGSSEGFIRREDTMGLLTWHWKRRLPGCTEEIHTP
jgi:hypothetical protein